MGVVDFEGLEPGKLVILRDGQVYEGFTWRGVTQVAATEDGYLDAFARAAHSAPHSAWVGATLKSVLINRDGFDLQGGYFTAWHDIGTDFVIKGVAKGVTVATEHFHVGSAQTALDFGTLFHGVEKIVIKPIAGRGPASGIEPVLMDDLQVTLAPHPAPAPTDWL